MTRPCYERLHGAFLVIFPASPEEMIENSRRFKEFPPAQATGLMYRLRLEKIGRAWYNPSLPLEDEKTEP